MALVSLAPRVTYDLCFHIFVEQLLHGASAFRRQRQCEDIEPRVIDKVVPAGSASCCGQLNTPKDCAGGTAEFACAASRLAAKIFESTII